jgi:hypothetical protein
VLQHPIGAYCVNRPVGQRKPPPVSSQHEKRRVPTTRLCGHADRPFDTEDECVARSSSCRSVLSGAAADINEPNRIAEREQSVHPRFARSEERLGAQTIETHDQTIGIAGAIDIGPHAVGRLAHAHNIARPSGTSVLLEAPDLFRGRPTRWRRARRGEPGAQW